MRADIDRLMAARGLDALVIAGGEGHNMARYYLSSGVHVTGGLIIKLQDEAPVLIVNAMETDEAAKSGLKVYSMYDMDWVDIFEKAEKDPTKATVAYWGNCLQKLGITSGKIGIYGTGDINYYVELIRLLDKTYPQYQFVGEMGTTLLDAATLTKDRDELARIQSVAARTVEVQQAVWDYISGHRADGDTVVKQDGAPLTIGDVRRFVLAALMERGLEDIGLIFAQGRDSGVPHSRGENSMALKLGQAIVFDLFPREIGGGYFHDTTRTWCIGYAPDDVREVYNTVMEAFDIAVEAYGLGKKTQLMQNAVLDYFEGKGHPTSRSKPGTTDGYVHTLGHGVGLRIHENPKISHHSDEDVFQVGNVITIEPGLYYPDKGYGVRVEDTFYVAEDGQLISLTDFRKDLVLPLRN
jgi:Xaa-Pro aminopeptidase